MEYSDFVDLNHTPSKSDLVCLYRVHPTNKIGISEAAGRIAAESSTGVPDKKLSTERTDIIRHVKDIAATAFDIKANFVKISFPEELWEHGNMPQILSCIAGGIFGISGIENLRLQDIIWPKRLVNSFLGPQFGLEGIRKLLKIGKRPLISLVAKPKMGMNPEEYSKTAYLAWLGGMDFFRDGDNVATDELNKFEEKISFTIKARERIEKQHGERKAYIPNVTAETREMLKRVKKVYDHGSDHVMINVSTAGWGSLQTLRDVTEDLKVAIHVQNLLPASMTRDPKNGISMLVASDIARLLGVDQLYIGSVIEGGNPVEEEHLMEPEVVVKFTSHNEPRLKDEIYGLNSVMPVVGGGVHPGIIPELMKTFGDNDFAMQFCDTVYTHPDGTRDGSAAMRQAIEATLKGMPLKNYAKNHIELWESIKQWGTRSV